MPRLYQIETLEDALQCVERPNLWTSDNELPSLFQTYQGKPHYKWDIKPADLINKSQQIDDLLCQVAGNCKGKFFWLEQLIPYPESKSLYLSPDYQVLLSQDDKGQPSRMSISLFLEAERDAFIVSQHPDICSSYRFKAVRNDHFIKKMGRIEKTFTSVVQMFGLQPSSGARIVSADPYLFQYHRDLISK